MNVKSIERKGNEATVVVEIDKELMESGVNKAYISGIVVYDLRDEPAPVYGVGA